MLTVTFFEDSQKRLSSFSATGHADAAQHGEDIVCAAVSAILQAARLGLAEHAGLKLEVTQEPGNMHVRWPEDARGDAGVAAIVATAQLSVEQIASQYPKHVRYRKRAE